MEFVLILAVISAVLIVMGYVGLAQTRRRPTVREAITEAEGEAVPEAEALEAPAVEAPLVKPRLRDRLGKARALMGDYLAEWRLRQRLDDQIWDELEEMLVVADVGAGMASVLIDDLRTKAKEEGWADADALIDALAADVAERLATGDRSLRFDTGERNVWMFVGVNGTGKTTTIGKVAREASSDGRQVVLVAADTFRAAAADQLAVWAERAGAHLVRGQEGADPGSVVFDGMDAAESRDADLVLVDTAGRLHTKVNLMEELKKLRRIVDRTDGALKEVLLVIDGTTGQNGLAQARQFAEAVQVTGVVLTKLDGTAKGGIVLAIQHELGLPVKLVGVGEGIDDLIEFEPREFAAALFD